jgi:hypothetical protein
MYCGRYKGDVAPLRRVAKCQADKIGQRATRHHTTIQVQRVWSRKGGHTKVIEVIMPSRCTPQSTIEGWRHGMVHCSYVPSCPCIVLVRLEPLPYKRARLTIVTTISPTHSLCFLKLCNLVPSAIQKQVNVGCYALAA